MRCGMRLAELALVSIIVSACSTSGENIPVRPIAPAVDPVIAVPCQEAAGEKYFMDPDRVLALSSTNDGANTIVVMKADVRDAVCTINAKGKVVSVVDTTPKSADQLAAEEAKAAAAAGGVVEEPVKPKKK